MLIANLDTRSLQNSGQKNLQLPAVHIKYGQQLIVYLVEVIVPVILSVLMYFRITSHLKLITSGHLPLVHHH